MNNPPPTDPQPAPRQSPRRRVAIILLAIVAIVLLVVLIATTTAGFGPYEDTTGAPRPPTLWDWLGLLIVPLAVAAGAAFISYVQKRTELEIAANARKEDRKIAEEARKSDQQIASDRLRQATLEGYYDRMTDLLLTHKLRNVRPEEVVEARSIALARTVAVVKGLDGERNRQLFAFLRTSGLINKDEPVIDLKGVDFSRADLRGAGLSRAGLSEANLSGANLSGANLSGANLSWANLRGADLRGANLRGANLSGAGLSGADLSGARGWTIEQLEQVIDIAGCTMPDGTQLGRPASRFTKAIEGPTFAEWKAQQKAEG